VPTAWPHPGLLRSPPRLTPTRHQQEAALWRPPFLLEREQASLGEAALMHLVVLVYCYDAPSGTTIIVFLALLKHEFFDT
jgi:hypothetical protein